MARYPGSAVDRSRAQPIATERKAQYDRVDADSLQPAVEGNGEYPLDLQTEEIPEMKSSSSTLSALFLAATLVSGAGLISVAGCASTQTQSGTGEYFDDTVVTTKVKTAIFNDPNLKVLEINVETFKGVVQLSGFVNSQSDIDRAVTVARGVAGVQSVKNDMKLK